MVELFVQNGKKLSDAFSDRFVEFLEEEFDGKGTCFSKEVLAGAHQRVTSQVEANLEKAIQSLGFIFEDEITPEEERHRTLQALDALDTKHENHLTLYSMALLAVYKFGLFLKDQRLVFPVLAAAVMGEIEHDLPYHNNFHFRKVLLHAMRLIKTHNEIFKGRKNVLDDAAIVKLLICPSIHDLGHDGKNNYASGSYEFARLEKRSFSCAEPILKEMGLAGSILDDIETMLITTDVLPFGDPMSPVNQMAAVYDDHFGMSEEDKLDLSPELAVLEDRPDLTLQCMLLHGADIMNSMGINYEITRSETKAINQEIGKDSVSPDDIWLFLNKICLNAMMSEAVRSLAESAIEEIFEQVKAEMAA